MAPKDGQHSSGHHVPRQTPTVRTPAAVPVVNASAAAPPAAAQAAPDPGSGLILPPSIVSRSDISRMLREIGVVDDFFHQSSLRGATPEEMPAASKQLDALAQANGLNLLQAEHRATIRSFLSRLKSSAPVVHMSFPSEASDQFLARLLEWFRREAHPYTVLHVGLMPELAAGCLVRTTNKMYDFSLRKRFEQSKEKLLAALVQLDESADRQAVAESTATVAEGERLQ